MPDISMCANHACPSNAECYRYRAEPNPYRQAYSVFTPDASGKCDSFVQVEPGYRLKQE